MTDLEADVCRCCQCMDCSPPPDWRPGEPIDRVPRADDDPMTAIERAFWTDNFDHLPSRCVR